MHKSYEAYHKHPADFRVRYRFYTEAEGGRQSGPPFQGYRSDLWYDYKDPIYPSQIFQIWPEFEDSNGEVITENNVSVEIRGTARMWIVRAPMRDYHKSKIYVGMSCFCREGSKSVAECEVIQILGLHSNPTI